MLLSSAADKGLFHSVLLPNCSTPVTHLQFADDVILFIQNDNISISGVKKVLQCFQLLSGLKINFQKSFLYGEKSTFDNLHAWANQLGCQVGFDSFTYLGSVIGSSPKSSKYWQPLLSKVESKLSQWNPSDISLAGRLILLQSVIDSAPVYWFSMFRIPKMVLQTLDRMRRGFLWGHDSNNHRKLHSINWDKICSPKASGGLGMASLQRRNISMLTKWWWRCYEERDKVWNKLFTERYGRVINHNLYDLMIPRGASSILESFVNIKSLPELVPLLNNECFRWRLGNGIKCFFWEDIWWSDRSLASLFPRLYGLVSVKYISVASVVSLWSPDNRCSFMWTRSILERESSMVSSICNIVAQISLNTYQDTLVWAPINGQFSSASCYKLLSPNLINGGNRHSIWQLIWKAPTPPKVKILLWKMQWDAIPTGKFLHKRMPHVSPLCQCCLSDIESITHIFWDCLFARWV